MDGNRRAMSGRKCCAKKESSHFAGKHVTCLLVPRRPAAAFTQPCGNSSSTRAAPAVHRRRRIAAAKYVAERSRRYYRDWLLSIGLCEGSEGQQTFRRISVEAPCTPRAASSIPKLENAPSSANRPRCPTKLDHVVSALPRTLLENGPRGPPPRGPAGQLTG
jgi:hypothetical protein